MLPSITGRPHNEAGNTARVNEHANLQERTEGGVQSLIFAGNVRPVLFCERAGKVFTVAFPPVNAGALLVQPVCCL